MLRPRAVRALLVEAAGVRAPAGAAAAEESGGGGEAAAQREALARARRRAFFVAGLDAAAIAVLLVLRQSDRFLVLGRNEETIFTVGVLVIAVHLGFRLAQAATIATARRLHAELLERED